MFKEMLKGLDAYDLCYNVIIFIFPYKIYHVIAALCHDGRPMRFSRYYTSMSMFWGNYRI